VSSFYLLLPVGLAPFLGIALDAFGRRVTIRSSLIFCPFLVLMLSEVFVSAVTFLVSMLLLKLSHSVPTFGMYLSVTISSWH
jgi:hypothetical protein